MAEVKREVWVIEDDTGNPLNAGVWGGDGLEFTPKGAVRYVPSPPTEAPKVEWVKNPRYEPKTLQQKLGYLVEECGEVMAAAGKSIRWGLDSYNPELPPHAQETNEQWLLREMADLAQAIQLLQATLSPPPPKASEGGK